MSNNNDLQSVRDALEQISETNSIGKMIASGIGVGIEENSYLAVTAMENVYVELETLYKNAQKNAEALEKKHQKRILDNLKNALGLNLITEKEYYEKLKEYRDTHLRQGTDAWYKCTEEIIFYNKHMADQVQSQQEKIASVYDSLGEKISDIRAELSEKLQLNDIDWFSANKITFKGMGEKGQDLVYNASDISDFQKETALLEQYRDAILALNSLGNIPGGVFEDISRMSIKDGLAAANAILSASDFTRSLFIKGYNQRDSLAESISAQLMPILNKTELESVADSAADAFNKAFFDTEDGMKPDFIRLLEESFASVPDSYYSLGGDAASSFEKGLFQELPGIMDSVRSYIRNSVSGLISGSAPLSPSPAPAVSGGGNTYNSHYIFNTSRDTTTVQLLAARRAETLSRLRGISQ